MKKIIEVREFNPPAGKEYDGTAYPGPGIYRTPTGWNMVYQCGISICAMNMSVGFAPPFPMEDYIEPKLEQAAGGITAADLIKAVAVSQNPLLAKELLR